MKLVESMSKKTAKLTEADFTVESRDGEGNPTYSAFDGKWHVKIRESNWGWRISAEDDRNNVRQQPIGSQYGTMQEAIDAWNQKKIASRTAREGEGDCVTDFALPEDDGHEKHAPDFEAAREIDELSDAAEEAVDGFDDGDPAGQIAKAEWVASRMAERRMARKVNDEVLHHLAGMGCAVGMVACAKLTDKEAYAEYKAEVEKMPKHASRKPRLATKEARYRAWAARKVAFGGDCEIFIGAVSNPTNGDWLKLPASESEIEEAIERAQTGPDGEFYEEVMISDTDGLGSSVGEYDDIYSVNEWVEAIEDAGLDDDLLDALLDYKSLEYVAEHIDDVDYWSDVYDERDLGHRIVDELGFDGISDDEKEMYFDYEGFGRDIVINGGYTIENGFAFRVASRSKLACDIHDRMLVALAERNIKAAESVKEKVEGKVKTKVKTCGKMGGRKNPKRKAAAMTASVKKAQSLYEQTVNIPDSDIDHWNSDLYLRKTPETETLIDGYEYKNQVTTFVDEIDGDVWYDIPFAYDPEWEHVR